VPALANALVPGSTGAYDGAMNPEALPGDEAIR